MPLIGRPRDFVPLTDGGWVPLCSFGRLGRIEFRQKSDGSLGRPFTGPGVEGEIDYLATGFRGAMTG